MLSLGTLFAPAFKEELEKLLSSSASPEHPLFVDLLLNGRALLERARTDDAPRSARYLLFEYDRIFLLHDAGTTKEPCVECFMRHTVDAHLFPEVYGLRRYYLDKGFSYLFDHSTLALLPDLLARCAPGAALVYLPRTAEVLTTSVLYQPLCCSPWHSASRANEKTLGLEERIVDASLRGPHRLDLEGLTSLSGIIRRENVLFNVSGTVSCITETGVFHGRHLEISGGVAWTPEEARFIARCEAMERYLMTYEPQDSTLYEAPYAAMPPEAVDPARLMFTLRYPPANGIVYTPDLPLAWTTAYSVTHKATRFVPAQEAWATNLSKSKCPRVRTSTNGCALGGSIEEAALHAFLELAERDCFLTTWYLQRACSRLDPASVSDANFQLLFRRFQMLHPYYQLHFFDTMNDLHIPAVWLLAVRRTGTGAKTFTCGGAGLTVERAMASALREVSGQMQKNLERDPDDLSAREILNDPTRLTEISDHATFYGLDEAFHRFDFLDLAKAPVSVASVQEHALIARAPSYDLREVLEQIADHLDRLGSELILKDLTLPYYQKRGFYCVRALAPDLYPVSFGYAEQRFSINERLQRLAQVYRGAPLRGLDDVNPDIHPFA